MKNKDIKTILLTGSGGFIGGNLKEYFKDKYNLLTPRSFELNLCDETAVSGYFKSHDIDFIIHCSATGGVRDIQDKDSTVEDNLKMVNNLFENKKAQTRMILFGSGAMYDRKRDLKKVKEDELGKHIPNELYGKAKLKIAEQIKGREDIVCLNIFGCYGKNEKESRFPSFAIMRNLKQEKIEINQNVVFDYLFIEDLERIVEYFIYNKPRNNIINVTPTESISLKEIAEIVNEISCFNSEITINNPVMNYEYTGDNSRLLSEIKGFKFTSYKEGLKKLYNEIKSNV